MILDSWLGQEMAAHESAIVPKKSKEIEQYKRILTSELDLIPTLIIIDSRKTESKTRVV